jgi:hypothetical protein
MPLKRYNVVEDMAFSFPGRAKHTDKLRSTSPSREHHRGAEGEIRVREQGEHLRDLLVYDEPGARPPLESARNSPQPGTPLLTALAILSRSPLHTQVDETMCPQTPIQAPAPAQGQITTACLHCHKHTS